MKRNTRVVGSYPDRIRLFGHSEKRCTRRTQFSEVVTFNGRLRWGVISLFRPLRSCSCSLSVRFCGRCRVKELDEPLNLPSSDGEHMYVLILDCAPRRPY